MAEPTIYLCEQKSYEWFDLRAGRVTGSEVATVQSYKWVGSKERGDKKRVETELRATYRASVVAETLTGVADMDGFNSAAMKWGAETEPKARIAYELYMKKPTDQIGFGVHGKINRFGASPDSLVEDLGGLEIKCLKTKNHLDILKNDAIPDEYLPQIYANMSVFDRDWWDWMSFDPRLPKELQSFVCRVHRDEDKIKEVEEKVEEFLGEVDREIEFLQARFGPFTVGKPEAAPQQTTEEWLEEFSGGTIIP